MGDTILQGLAYTLPALVTGGVAYMILEKFTEQNNNKRKFEALLTKKRESLPLKLQAYERLLLFCDRINPSKLILRVPPIGEDAISYQHLLIGNIEQEFEHNMVQQLYVSDDVWKAVVGSKLAIINKINSFTEQYYTAEALRKAILNEYSNVESPTNIANSFIKKEVKTLL